MKRYIALVATLWVSLSFFCAGNVFAQSGELDSGDAETLVYLREFSKMKWDIFYLLTLSDDDDPVRHSMYVSLANSAEMHQDKLALLLDHYGISDPVKSPYTYNYIWDYSNEFIIDLMSSYIDFFVWEQPSEESVLDRIAYIVEMNILDLRQAILDTDKQLLVNTYSEVLTGAYTQLLTLISLSHSNPFEYQAQLMSQEDVEEIIAAALGENFEINRTLNDAWYEPTTVGQGFFITVFPEKGTVFLGWFTFDMDFPNQDVIAGLGDSCQRWLTAQGPYDGNQADLVVHNSSGGLFDSELAEPQLEPIGSITLQFENCESGTVSYELPSYGLMGDIPIQRVASDNIAACQLKSYLNR